MLVSLLPLLVSSAVLLHITNETSVFYVTTDTSVLLHVTADRLQDYEEPIKLLSRDNVSQEALMAYARQAADVSTNHLLPDLDFAHNHYGQPDVAMFDFTSMFAAEHASRVLERGGHKLLLALVGDSLLEVSQRRAPAENTCRCFQWR